MALSWIYRLALDPAKSKLSNDERAALKANIQLLRDAIVLFTTTGSARGLSGHTGMYARRRLCLLY